MSRKLLKSKFNSVKTYLTKNLHQFSEIEKRETKMCMLHLAYFKSKFIVQILFELTYTGNELHSARRPAPVQMSRLFF